MIGSSSESSMILSAGPSPGDGRIEEGFCWILQV